MISIEEGDIWDKYSSNNGYTCYQCMKLPSLFKEVAPNGIVEYTDFNRVACIDVNDPNTRFLMPFVIRIIDELFPITMPYIPMEPIDVYCERLSYDNIKYEPIDTFGVFYILKDNEKININRFFKLVKVDEKYMREWIEISEDEYKTRKGETKNE